MQHNSRSPTQGQVGRPVYVHARRAGQACSLSLLAYVVPLPGPVPGVPAASLEPGASGPLTRSSDASPVPLQSIRSIAASLPGSRNASLPKNGDGSWSTLQANIGMRAYLGSERRSFMRMQHVCYLYKPVLASTAHATSASLLRGTVRQARNVTWPATASQL